MLTGNPGIFMTRSQLIELLANPRLLDEETLSPLKEVLDAYPFFQAGRMLWIKNLHQLDHIRFNSELKTAAAYVADRSKLFFLINDLVAPLSGTAEVQGEIAVEREEPGSPEPALSAGGTTESTPSGNRIKGLLENAVANDFVFPSADLLDYERETYSAAAYSLEARAPELEVDADESHSFSEWLSVLRHGPAKKQKEEARKAEPLPSRDRRMDLIDNFLTNGGHRERIVPNDDKGTSGKEVSMKSVQENEDLMTETLANIFIRQKHYRKAANIFERLRLKYPEKSVYFVRRLKELEELINNQ